MTIKRCYPVLVGASVAENQLLPVHISYTVVSGDATGLTIDVTDGYINITGTASADVQINVLPFTSAQNYVQANHVSLMLCEGWNGFSWSRAGFPANTLPYYMNKHTTVFSAGVRIQLTSGTTYNIHARFSVTDITKKFGSSIADYVYSLEQQTAGNGIAWLRKYGFITDEYKPYNTGTIESVEATAKVVRDENGENAVTYPLGSDVLRGIFKLDANNNLYADGDRKEADGTITRKYYIKTVNGSESWAKSTSYPGNYYLSFGATGGKLNSINIITSNGLEPISTLTELAQKDMVIFFDGGLPNPNINIKNASMTTLDDFKGWLSNNPITIVYELNTPTTEISTPFTSPQLVYPDGTEEYVTGNGVPVGHETKYQL